MRRLVLIAFAVIFLLSAASIPVFAATSMDRIATFEDISTLVDDGQLRWFSIYSTKADSRNNVEINTNPEYAHNSRKSLKLYQGTSNRNFFYNTDSATITKGSATSSATVELCYRFEYKYYMKVDEYSDEYSNSGIVFAENPQIRYGGSTSYRAFTNLNIQMIKTGQGDIRIQMGNNSSESVYLTDGAEYDWIEVIRLFDFEKSTASTYVNGELLAVREIDDLEMLRMTAVSVTGSDTSKGIYFDDVSSKTYEWPPKVSEVSAEKDAVSAAFSKPLDKDSVTPDNFSITLGGKSVGVSAAEYVEEENKVVLTPAKVLAAEEDYTLSVSGDVKCTSGIRVGEGAGAESTFKIAAKDYDVLDVKAEGGKLKASVVNTTGNSQNVIMAAVFTDADGKIVSFGFSELKEVSGAGAEIEISLPGAGETGCEVFFVNGWEDVLPSWKYVYTVTEL